MSRYSKPIDYGQRDYDLEIDGWEAVNGFGRYAPEGVDDVGEALPRPKQPEQPSPKPPAPTMAELMAENRRKLAAYRAEDPERMDFTENYERWREKLSDQ